MGQKALSKTLKSFSNTHFNLTEFTKVSKDSTGIIKTHHDLPFLTSGHEGSLGIILAHKGSPGLTRDHRAVLYQLPYLLTVLQVFLNQSIITFQRSTNRFQSYFEVIDGTSSISIHLELALLAHLAAREELEQRDQQTL